MSDFLTVLGQGLLGGREGFPVHQLLIKAYRLFFPFDGKIKDLFEGIKVHVTPLMQKMIINDTMANGLIPAGDTFKTEAGLNRWHR